LLILTLIMMEFTTTTTTTATNFIIIFTFCKIIIKIKNLFSSITINNSLIIKVIINFWVNQEHDLSLILIKKIIII